MLIVASVLVVGLARTVRLRLMSVIHNPARITEHVLINWEAFYVSALWDLEVKAICLPSTLSWWIVGFLSFSLNRYRRTTTDIYINS